MFRFDGANIQQFPDIPAVSAEILALRGWEGEKRRAAVRAVAFGAALLGGITSQGDPPVTFGSSVISNDILGGNVPVPPVFAIGTPKISGATLDEVA